MPRYFLEVSYKGTRYSGFQVQNNAVTIQSEVEKALETYYKTKISLTGSSRTDTGVHASQNFFHFDFEGNIYSEQLYNINAILPNDIVAKRIYQVSDNAHCRFDAVAREYCYYIYQEKNPFLEKKAWFYPYKLDIDLLQKAADIIITVNDFTTFSKRNTQVNNFNCTIQQSFWQQQNDCLVYNVKANRFLRGMVRGLVATMLKVGRHQITIQEFIDIINSRDCTTADFTTPAHGLFLKQVVYPQNFF
jgi:tRNA pseudouridine38-40 synthase